METIGSKRSYALTWCMPNNDDDDDDGKKERLSTVYARIKPGSIKNTTHDKK